ncbi:hypothetical protein GCM10027421_04850 [Microbacterium shaanxiense]
MDRYRLPRWINALIDWLADHPMSLPGRLAALRMGRPAPRGSVPTTTFDDRPQRVLIAPVNYSGQGREWARALEKSDAQISARNMAIEVPGGFSFDADLVVPVATYHNDRDWQRRQFAAASDATHVLIEAEEPPFGRLFGRSVRSQAEALLERNVNVAFLGHGTDVRLPSRHIQVNPLSYFADPGIYTPRLETVAQRNIDFIVNSGRPLFVSTPDLLDDLPTAIWCPVVVDPARWRAERPQGRSGPLRIAHAPSVAIAKGTPLIMPILHQLEAEGLITVEIVSGIPSERMPEVFARADVVIDQLRAGSYGVAACEAMAAGCVVIGQVATPTRDRVRDLTGLSLPILEATPDTIENVLRDLASRDNLSNLGYRGTSFVQHVHDGRRSAEALRGSWIAPGQTDHGKVSDASVR